MTGRNKGWTARVRQNTDAEYDVELASEATAWIKEVVGEGDFKSNNSADVQEALKDGVLLCKLINVLQPGSVEKINTSSKAKFKQMKNITNFLIGCEDYGLAKDELFQAVDLYEEQDMARVINGIHALGRKGKEKKFDGPLIGSQESSE